MSRVEVCTPEEAASVIAQLGVTPVAPYPVFKGWVDVVCRNARGGVEWEVHQPNLITDVGRRILPNSWWATGSVYIFTSPSAETAMAERSSLFDDGATTSSQITGAGVTPTKDAVTLTRTYNTTFSAPVGSNRTVGTVGLAPSSGRETATGIAFILAYTVLSPVRIQTTSSTLEITYKVTMTPST